MLTLPNSRYKLTTRHLDPFGASSTINPLFIRRAR
jgi:hypothetical protein